MNLGETNAILIYKTACYGEICLPDWADGVKSSISQSYICIPAGAGRWELA